MGDLAVTVHGLTAVKLPASKPVRRTLPDAGWSKLDSYQLTHDDADMISGSRERKVDGFPKMASYYYQYRTDDAADDDCPATSGDACLPG